MKYKIDDSVPVNTRTNIVEWSCKCFLWMLLFIACEIMCLHGCAVVNRLDRVITLLEKIK